MCVRLIVGWRRLPVAASRRFRPRRFTPRRFPGGPAKLTEENLRWLGGSMRNMAWHSGLSHQSITVYFQSLLEGLHISLRCDNFCES